MISDDDRRGLVDAATAAALLDIDEGSVRRARERYQLGRVHRDRVVFTIADLVRAPVLPVLPGEAKEVLRTAPIRGPVRVNLTDPKEGPPVGVMIRLDERRRWVVEKVLAFRRGARHVVSNPDLLGGAPVFRGTRIPVEQIGHMLLKGDSEEELLKDFPALTRDDLAYARTVAKRGPGPGRPRKPIEFRR